MRPTKYTRALLEPVVRQSKTISEVLRNLGLRPSGSLHRLLWTKIREFQLDTSHFTGQAWSRGKTAETDARVKRCQVKRRYTDTEVFCEHSPVRSYQVARRLREAGRPYLCEQPGCPVGQTWNGNPLSLHLHHKNGVSDDNRQENLMFLCPNCHQQTDTWGVKNAQKAA